MIKRKKKIDKPTKQREVKLWKDCACGIKRG